MGIGEGGWNLFIVVEADLTGCHAGVFVKVRPGRVDDCYIVPFVACLSHPLVNFRPVFRSIIRKTRIVREGNRIFPPHPSSSFLQHNKDTL